MNPTDWHNADRILFPATLVEGTTYRFRAPVPGTDIVFHVDQYKLGGEMLSPGMRVLCACNPQDQFAQVVGHVGFTDTSHPCPDCGDDTGSCDGFCENPVQIVPVNAWRTKET